MENPNPYAYTIDSPLVNTSSRAAEALRHLQILGITALPQATGIIEIGSGQGGVTQALRALAPHAPLIAIDQDTSPRVQEAAQINNAIFFRADIAAFSTDGLNQLIQAHHVKNIVAFRIPAVVAHDIITKLSHANFEGQFAFSIIQLPQETEGLRRMSIGNSFLRDRKRTFEENRLITEYGYCVTYPLVNEEEVA